MIPIAKPAPSPRAKVSILIPCFNAESFVAEAIQSAIDQTWENIEIIAVDDGSTDGSINVLRSFGDRIKFITGPNRGACAARNEAFSLSSGEFVQFLDADDVIHPNKITRQLSVLLNENADIVLSKIGLFGDDKGRRLEKRPHPEPVGDPMLYFARHPISTEAPLHRRSFIERSGGFLVGLKRGQEYDLHLRLGALNPRLAMVDDVLVWVRMHDGDRISKRSSDVNQVVATWCNLAAHIDFNEAWTTERRLLVGKHLLEASRSCFAAGNTEMAKSGLRKAIEVCPAVTRLDRASRRLLTHLLGIERAEAVVAKLRTFRMK